MKTTIALALALVFALFATRTAMQAQSLIDADDLTYDSEFERSVFQSLEPGQPADLAMFMAMGAEATSDRYTYARKFVDGIVEQVREPLFKKKTFPKQIEYLQATLQADYLHKYELVVPFSELIQSGTFNCLTSTALFAFVLDRLKIPFQVYEKPDHAYLTAGNTELVVIESTAPTDGVFTPNEKFRKAFVSALTQKKIVSVEELRAQGVDSIFKNSLLQDVKIDLRQLAGLQYRNDALVKLESYDWKGAEKQYKKSYFLYPTETTKALICVTGIFQFDKAEISDLERIRLGTEVVKFCPKSSDPYKFRKKLAAEIEHYFIDHHTKTDWETVESIIQNYRDDTLVFGEAKYTFVAQNFQQRCTLPNDSCYQMGLELHAMKPQAEFSRRALVAGFLYDEMKENDLVIIIADLEKFAEKYAFAWDMDPFRRAYGFAHLDIAAAKYESDDQVTGEKYLKAFEKYNATAELSDAAQPIGQTYAAAVRSYMRKSNNTKAKQYLQQGLALAPYSTDINACKRHFGEYLGVR